VEITYKKEANLCLYYGYSDHYIRQCHLGLIKKPNATPAYIKKLKASIIATKSKKRPIITPATINKTKSSDKTSLINELENK
jgi:hypothetical protein